MVTKIDGSAIGTMQCMDISKGGMFLSTQGALPVVFSKVKITIPSAGNLELLAEVVRHVPADQAKAWGMSPEIGLLAGVAGAAALGLVTGALAWVGLHTPSPLPAVTVINVLGGLALVGLSTALLYSSSPAPAATASEASPFLRRALWAVLALLALQAAVGAMISARLAASACASGCEQLEWSAKVTELLNPMLIGRVEALAVEPTAGQSLHWLHRILGAALLVAASVMVYVLGAASGAALRRLAWVLAATFAMGVAGAVFDGHLLVTVVHALLAGLAAAALGITLMAALRPRAARS